jgi:hypothetical protein
MTVEELVAYQAAHGLGDRHVIWLADDGFRIAHTDAERAAGVDLMYCQVHQALLDADEAPAPPGLYETRLWLKELPCD